MADDFCWSCSGQKKNVNGTKGEYHSGICQECIDDQEAKLKQFNAELIQTDREPHYSGYHDQVTNVRDVAVKANGQTYFIQGFHTCEAAYDTSKAFNQVKQFIDTGFKYHIRYGNLDLLKKYDFWFYVQKYGQFYELCGNCNGYSNAFSLRTTDINQVWEYVEVWTKIPEKLKMRIKAQLDKALVFSSGEAHSPVKAFRFVDYSDYKETKTAKVIPIKGFSLQAQEQMEI